MKVSVFIKKELKFDMISILKKRNLKKVIQFCCSTQD